MADYIDSVLALAASAAAFGSQISPSGAMLYGHVPHVASQAWFHVIFPGLTDAELGNLESLIDCAIPAAFRELLARSNGMSLFSGQLSIYGFRKNWKRVGNDVWFPFSVVSPNTTERPRWLDPGEFIFGGLRADGSKLCINRESGKISRYNLKTSEAIENWSDLETMFAVELSRIGRQFDGHGRRKTETTIA